MHTQSSLPTGDVDRLSAGCVEQQGSPHEAIPGRCTR